MLFLSWVLHCEGATMLTIQKMFSQLRLIMNTATHNTGSCSNVSNGITRNMQQMMASTSKSAPQTMSRLCAQWYSSSTKSSSQDVSNVKVKSYDPPSPYRNPGPRRYGYEPKFFTGGLLPRGEDTKPIRSLPKHKVKNNWDKKRALFGQNDYIDILGDGSIRPVDLIRGPDWLIGFKGNELQRLVRRMNFHGDKLKLLYPHKYHNIQKRIFFLHKKYNQKRGKRVGS